MIGEGSLWFLGVREADQGQDLNGDGDLADEVVHVYDVRRDSLTNVGQALDTRAEGTLFQQPRVAGRWIAFLVDEFAQGGIDVNGDGDALDAILWTYDADRQEARSLELTVPNFSGVLELTDERLVTAALDDDYGLGLFDHDLQARVTRRIDGSASGTPMTVHGDHLAVAMIESPRGSGASVDLNGDGDFGDSILRIFDFRTRTLLSTGLASIRAATPLGDDWLVPVYELQQGGQDLDGDGSTLGHSYHVHDTTTGASRNLALPLPSQQVVAVGDQVFFGVFESQARKDLNGDGDGGDVVLFVVDARTGSATNLGLAFERMVELDRWLVVSVPESNQGLVDLTGDGDFDDEALHAIDLRSLRVQNLATDAALFPFQDAAVGNSLFFVRQEGAAGVDWNGDGDLEDRVLFRWNGNTGELSNSGIGCVGLETDGRRLLIEQVESEEGVDLNGDGDLLDLVASVVGVRTLGRRSVGIAGVADLGSRGTVIVRARESWEGRDLNGDGDLLDEVPHVVRGMIVP